MRRITPRGPTGDSGEGVGIERHLAAVDLFGPAKLHVGLEVDDRPTLRVSKARSIWPSTSAPSRRWRSGASRWQARPALSRRAAVEEPDARPHARPQSQRASRSSSGAASTRACRVREIAERHDSRHRAERGEQRVDQDAKPLPGGRERLRPTRLRSRGASSGRARRDRGPSGRSLAHHSVAVTIVQGRHARVSRHGRARQRATRRNVRDQRQRLPGGRPSRSSRHDAVRACHRLDHRAAADPTRPR